MHASLSIQEMYRRYLIQNWVFPQKGKKNQGVFGEIFEIMPCKTK